MGKDSGFDMGGFAGGVLIGTLLSSGSGSSKPSGGGDDDFSFWVFIAGFLLFVLFWWVIPFISWMGELLDMLHEKHLVAWFLVWGIIWAPVVWLVVWMVIRFLPGAMMGDAFADWERSRRAMGDKVRYCPRCWGHRETQEQVAKRRLLDHPDWRVGEDGWTVNTFKLIPSKISSMGQLVPCDRCRGTGIRKHWLS
jgi:hypothetical protein